MKAAVKAKLTDIFNIKLRTSWSTIELYYLESHNLAQARLTHSFAFQAQFAEICLVNLI